MLPRLGSEPWPPAGILRFIGANMLSLGFCWRASRASPFYTSYVILGDTPRDAAEKF
jgi:hypothetical protein